MTKIIEKDNETNMRLHIDKAYAIINENIPTYYVRKVLEKLPENTSISSGMIRNVRNQTNKKLDSRLDIINLLVEVALDHKNEREKLKKL